MYDGMLTAGEVRKFYGANTLQFLQTVRFGLTVGPDRQEPNKYGGMTQLYSRNRVQEAAVFAVGGVRPEEYCSQAFFCGLLGVSRKEMLPEQDVYFKAGAAIKARLEKPEPAPKIRPKRTVNQVVNKTLVAKNLLDW